MKKKLIAAALAALPVAAMADVTLYGTMNIGLEHDSITNGASNNGVHDYTSLIGFKGNEDLGNGLKTVWQVENRVHLGASPQNGTNADGFGSRQTFVGLDGGNLGMIRVGTLNSALQDQYQVSQWQSDGEFGSFINRGDTADTTTFNPEQVTGANGLTVFTNQQQRLKNAVRYDTATFAGFNANIEYGFGENKNKSSSVNTASDVIALGLNYSIADFGFHYGYQQERNPGNQSDSPKTAKINYLEADYNASSGPLAGLFVGLAYQQAVGYDWFDGLSGSSASVSNLAYKTEIAKSGMSKADATSTANAVSPAALQLKTKQAALSVAYTMGAFTPKFSYAKGWNQSANDDSGSRANSGYSQYVLGVDYALSKRTSAELAYGSAKFGKGTTLGVANGDQDTKVSTVALSMMHSF